MGVLHLACEAVEDIGWPPQGRGVADQSTSASGASGIDSFELGDASLNPPLPGQQELEDRDPRRTKIKIDEQKIEQFTILFQEFFRTYVPSEQGERRIRLYRTARSTEENPI